jgi:hypothetical protein
MLTTLIDPLDPRPLGLTRILVGAAALAKAVILIPLLAELTTPGILTVPVFDWMPPPTPALAWSLLAVWLIAGALFTLGVWVPASGPLLLVCVVTPLVLDSQTYSNHLYLMAWLVILLVIADSGAGRAVIGRDRPVANWTVLLIALQISLVYFFSAINKLNPEFLSGEVLAGSLSGGLVPFPESLRTPRFLAPLAIGAIMAESFLAFGLWSPRLRRLAFAVGVVLHASITLLMADTMELAVFSALMLSTYPLFGQVAPAHEARATRLSPGTA